MNEEEKMIPQNQSAFYIDTFRPEDAEGIVRLFRSVYGEGYPIRLFYDREAIIAANREGSYISIVARTPDGEVIGVSHLYRSSPYRGLYEVGVGLVLKDYRNSGASKATLSYLFNEFVPKNPQIEELFGEAVCNHVFMQKTIPPSMHKETAIEVALMPAEAYTTEKSAQGRVAVLDAFRCYVTKPHQIFLPPVYEEILGRTYSRLDYDRTIDISEVELPSSSQTRAELQIFDFARVARIAVEHAGSDFAARISELESNARAKNVIVFQVWLNLAEPWVGGAAELLREKGYFYGGALPRWFDSDGLLMQKTDCDPDFENIILYADFSKELLEFIQRDRKQLY